MNTIISIAQEEVWDRALEAGAYTQSTVDKTLEDVGFLHCTFPDQTMDVVPRFADRQDLGRLVLLLINADKVSSHIKFEGALSGRAGVFPHIYGPLNVDAVYAVIPLAKNETGEFVSPEELLEAQRIQTEFNPFDN
jgi:glutathione S-transferase